MRVHITRISNGDVYGHQTAQCDAGGCANCEHYFSNVSAARTADAWWAWHDADADRWSADQSAAEARCAAWVAGTSDDGPSCVRVGDVVETEPDPDTYDVYAYQIRDELWERIGELREQRAAEIEVEDA